MLVAGALQLLLAATFLVVPIVVYFRGARAQRAAEAEVSRQGYPGAIAKRRMNFAETGAQFVLAEVIAIALATLGVLNLAGSGTGRVLSWVAAPIVLLVVGSVTAGQVFVRRYVAAAFAKFDDTRGVDAGAVVDAAQRAYPAWLRPVVVVRFLLATAGSVAVIVLLAVGG